MTFTQIKTKILNYCALTSPEADTRVGLAINATYRRVTSSLGLDAARFVTRSVTMTEGVRTVTFTEIEKIDRIIDASDSTAIVLLQEVGLHELRSTQPGTGAPTKWALQNTDADSVTILTDTVPATGSSWDLQADGWTTLSDLSGSDEPVFPESFHDILVWEVIAEELLKKEKDKLAATYERKAERLLEYLRFHLADSPTRDVRQGMRDGATGGTGSSGGGGTVGGTAYTQSGLLTFDRGAGVAPFAVARTDAPYVANLGAEFLGNITTDRLIGRDTTGTGESEQLTVGGGIEFTGSGGIQRSALTGDVTASAGSGATTIATDAVTTAKILNANVTNAKLADMAQATIKGRAAAAGTGAPTDLTANQVSTILDSATDPFVRTSAASTGTVDTTGTPADNQIAVFTDANTIEGASGLTYDGTTLTIPGQIAFPATQAASAGANTLDDYEEGTWTPSLGGNTTYTTQVGHYTKVGRLVQVRCSLVVNNIGTGSTNTISGLPFAPAVAGEGGGVGYFTSLAISTIFLSAYTSGSAVIFNGQAASGTGMSNGVNLLGSSSRVDFAFSYHT